MDTRIIEQLEAVFGQEIDPAGCDLGTLETTIKQGLELLGNNGWLSGPTKVIGAVISVASVEGYLASGDGLDYTV
ncbi:MAG: hypothetical protein JW749_10980 [Sedimentisphaerales bacterium]|nr:hypothetical protein [Sedimentisphaerales bacterium]